MYPVSPVSPSFRVCKALISTSAMGRGRLDCPLLQKQKSDKTGRVSSCHYKSGKILLSLWINLSPLYRPKCPRFAVTDSSELFWYCSPITHVLVTHFRSSRSGWSFTSRGLKREQLIPLFRF